LAGQNGWWRVSQLHKIKGEGVQLLFFADSSSFLSHLFFACSFVPGGGLPLIVMVLVYNSWRSPTTPRPTPGSHLGLARSPGLPERGSSPSARYREHLRTRRKSGRRVAGGRCTM
jgi:hypothetical protein